MDVRRIQEDINHLLIRLEEQYSRILAYKEQIPTVEVDLVLKDVRDLYEVFLDLRTAAETQRRKPLSVSVEETPVAKVETAVVEAEIEPVVELTKVEEVKSEPVLNPVSEVAMLAEPIAEVNVEEPIEKIAPVEAATPVIEEKQKPEELAVALPSEKPPVITPKVDILQERQKDFVPTVRKIEFKPEPSPVTDGKKESLFEKAASLYDKIAKPAEKTVAGQATRQPVSNIKAAIGINEKFAYLKELFKNNVNDYNEALEKLNNFESYGDAEDFFQELKSKYEWDPESKSFQGLADLLNRRYLHNA
jgi:hypothetical protein